jgi:hypothetical protein
MKRHFLPLLTGLLMTTVMAGSATAQMPKEKLESLAAGIAAKLAAACPRAATSDVPAHTACAKALRAMTDLPLVAEIAWGGDQPDLRVAKKHLTNLGSEIFRALYLSLFWFDGTWSVSHDDRDDVDIIHVGAFFRNKMPPDEFPYPFWHSADKWSAYEHANELNFYVDPSGSVFAVTRGAGGNEAARGEELTHQEQAKFEGKWVWSDDSGEHPKASLFSNKYSPDNPYMDALDKTYRALALELRDGSCLRCHSPNNRAEADRLVLFQTPAHAAAEIKNVLKAVRAGDMPQNDWGAKKALDPQLRETLLSSGEEFSKTLSEADQWETQHRKP